MPDLTTVFGRSKRNGGFMSGPDHQLLGMDRLQAETDDGPPNLRDAEDPEQACSTCEHFDGQGSCAKYNTPVEEADVCDDWEPMGEQSADVAAMSGAMGM